MGFIDFDETTCPICNRVIHEDDDYIGTTHFVADETSPLWNYSDAAIHRACFLAWPLRKSFVAKYNEAMGALPWPSGTFHAMLPDGTIPE